MCIVILTVEGGVDMIEKMAMGLVDQMAEEKMIDKEAEEYYVYTLVSLMEKVYNHWNYFANKCTD